MSTDQESTFASAKQAVAYALSHRRGPQLRRASLGSSPQGTYRDPWDASLVRAAMVRAGIAPGSPEERELADWARGQGPKPPELERALRRELDAAGLLARPETEVTRRSALVLVSWTDPDTGLPVEMVSLTDTEEVAK